MEGIIRLIAGCTAEARFSARVVLTTIFGDALLPRGQEIPVQVLTGLVGPLGINDRLVRTSLHRLSQEGLVTSERRGRQSFYRVADQARPTFAAADRRIYAAGAVSWDGEWTTAVTDPTSPDRSHVDATLRWLGLGAVTPDVYMSPTADPAAVADALDEPLLALSRGPLVAGAGIGDQALAALTAPVADLDAVYRAHLERFEPVLAGAAELADVDAFVVRTLLIDSWRRIVLRAPDIPDELLPDDWSGRRAAALTAALYRALLDPSDHHLDALLGPSNAPPPPRFTTT